MSNATEVRRSMSVGATMTADQQHSRRWAALAVIALVQFIIVLDITVVNVALPHIQTSLHFSRAGLAWVVDGYVLTAGGLLLLGGRLADLLGRKRMFLIGLAVFAVGSVLSGAAADSAMLVAARFLQGVGEAIAIPAAFGLVALLFTEPKERATAIGITGGVAGLGGTLGPVISGILISVASWRWIFYINVPVAVIAILAVSRLVARAGPSTGLQFGPRARPTAAGPPTWPAPCWAPAGWWASCTGSSPPPTTPGARPRCGSPWPLVPPPVWPSWCGNAPPWPRWFPPGSCATAPG